MTAEVTMERLRENALRHLAPYNIPAEALDRAIEAIIGTWVVMDAERRGVISAAALSTVAPAAS